MLTCTNPQPRCDRPDYVSTRLCNRTMTEPCVPLHAVAKACNSARLYSDISDSWSQKGNSGIKQIIEFWQANPQLAELRNTLPAGEA